MEKIAFVCGGPSLEKEISCLTSLKICEELEKKNIPYLLIYLDENHQFFLVKVLTSSFIKDKKITKGKFILKNNRCYFKTRFKKYSFDKILILGHGKNMEDGSLSCYFKQMNIPCLSEDIYNSSIIQDKVKFKLLLKGLNISSLDFEYLYKYQITDKKVISKINKKFNYPIIVKPSCLGSSIGISKVNDKNELPEALFEAFLYDTRVLVEPFIENKREINVSILGYENEIEVSNLEEVNNNNLVLSFYDKYDYSSNNQKRVINLPLEEKLKERIIETSKKIFKALNLCGLVRFDYIYDVEKEKVYLNEANLIPGSLSYYLFENKYSIVSLCEKYIKNLEKKQKDENLLLTSFQEGFMNKVDLSKLKK